MTKIYKVRFTHDFIVVTDKEYNVINMAKEAFKSANGYIGNSEDNYKIIDSKEADEVEAYEED